MKKEYKTPVVKTISLSTEEGVLNVGSPQGDFSGLGERPEDDDAANNFSNRRGGIWGDTEW